MSRIRSLKIRQALSALQIITLLTFMFAGFPGAAYSAPPPGPKAISIAQARSLPLGTAVTIDGLVTVASGTFSSSTFDQGFAIQDSTGGIYVSVPVNHSLAPRQQVRVTGELSDNGFGLLVITDVTAIKVMGRGRTVQPLSVATGDVDEGTEGTIVRITGTITQPVVNDLPFGFIIVVNDGTGEVNVFVCASTDIDVSGLSQGQTIEVTGFSGQFGDHFEVDPRTQDDIRIVN